MSDLKQVKVDNWGIYFLQRLKHFFNRTDYCDLTLQFQDNAQLKVHRLVLSACTEYFELLERTCEMYEDCLVMPDDLQADVVVPIVNFMYTGQLEFRMDLLESLYQTSQIMNMPVLTKLLDAHRYHTQPNKQPILNYNATKRSYSKNAEPTKQRQPQPAASSSKRSYSKAFGSITPIPQNEKKQHNTTKTTEVANNGITYHSPSPISAPLGSVNTSKKLREPRPTRYELPEELDSDNIFDNSFTNISYTSQPLMVHPEARKSYHSKKGGVFDEASSSKKFGSTSTVDIVECKKVTRKDNIFDDEDGISEETHMFHAHLKPKEEVPVSNQLFDQILDSQDGPKVTIETRDSKQATNIDHAKIISEVLKKYPHLVKSNKNIKLKILNTPSASKSKRQRTSPTPYLEDKVKTEIPDFTYETDVMDSKEAARLIALGAENVKGPWICLICGTPGRALHFTSYYKFRRHLVEVHNEKPISKICEYCGLKSLKRNYLLHHLYTKHGVEPPPSYHFPKCNICNYIALTEGFLVKHKLSHAETRTFRCNVCASTYSTSGLLLAHIQATGHKYSADRKTNLQCIYCLKVFLRESNLYAHLKTNHRQAAKSDGIIEESDEEKQEETVKAPIVKYEPPTFDNEYEDMDNQYQIQQRPDGNIELVSKKHILASSPTKQKILNAGLTTSITKPAPKPKPITKPLNNKYGYLHEVSLSNKNHEEIVMIDNNEYIMRDNQLIPRKKGSPCDYIVHDTENTLTSTSMEFSNIHDTIPDESIQEQKVVIKKSANINQPIQIVVSNEEEYKALMHSNHSIIFDDGDANKTLTVLSAPHSTPLNTSTIDLDNPQSSDMMIIPDNYPLNVSEHLPNDNSNIVVVYSHPVDEQNKQYQLISSQDIGTQFVQSSAVITQNYETITTSTPVMSAHVIDTQVAESWQNNIEGSMHNQETQMASEAELQEMTVAEEAVMPATENVTTDDSLNELPEVTLASAISQEKSVDEQPIEENLTHSDTINTETVNDENLEQVVEEEVQNISNTSMDIDATTEAVLEDNVNDKPSEIAEPSETLVQDDASIEQSNVNEEQIIDESAIIEHGLEVEDSEELIEENQNETVQMVDNVTTDAEGDADNLDEQASVAEIVPVNNEVPLPSVVKEQIQSLASEWSEDEDDTEAQDPTNPDESVSKDPENIPLVTETPADVEESIENIQQEMEKQMNETPETDINTEESVNSSQEDKLTNLKEDPQPQIAAAVPQEKISSLLNDWEDNDSQEGNDSTNANDSEPIPPEAADPVNEEVDKHEQKKDEKIKSLVSDWDDDEEENKT